MTTTVNGIYFSYEERTDRRPRERRPPHLPRPPQGHPRRRHHHPRIAARARKLADQISEDGYIDDEKLEKLVDAAIGHIEEVEDWARSWGTTSDTLTLIEGIRADCARLEVDLTDLGNLDELLTGEAERVADQLAADALDDDEEEDDDTDTEENTMTNETNSPLNPAPATQPLATEENTMTHSTALTARIAALNAADAHLKTMPTGDLYVPDGLTSVLVLVNHEEHGHALASLSRSALQLADGQISSPYNIIEEKGVYLLPLEEEKIEEGDTQEVFPGHYIFFDADSDAVWGPALETNTIENRRMLLAGESVHLKIADEESDCYLATEDAVELFSHSTAFWYDIIDAGRTEPDGWLVDTAEKDAPIFL
ncbi:hypothetical protein [Deinococcus marmoris]|uniref:Uncharacterized protein n=1 Tax=Deinococcus marmoris TaxID=249408 RepID=A0A1U7P315_9DEIO|nr:hypothetical protein [Deinococcus marmoris]OLV19554.1 hypothetical protein BOO71_0002401 [Deinococcus marmoris]